MNNNGVTTLFAFTHGRAFKVVQRRADSLRTNLSFFSPGNTGSVTVTKNLSATGPCDWRDEQQLLYHDRFRASGSGNGTVNFTVAPNTTGVARVGTLTVAGRNVTITQDAGPIVQ